MHKRINRRLQDNEFGVRLDSLLEVSDRTLVNVGRLHAASREDFVHHFTNTDVVALLGDYMVTGA